MKTLRLPLKKEWFEMTKSGIKTEEYREINMYWFFRLIENPYRITINGYSYLEIRIIELLNNGIKADNIVFKHFDTTTLTLGYPSNSDKERIIEFEQLSISIGYGKEEWGAEPNKLYFIIKHGKRIRMTKRQIVYNKFDGRCTYCGCELNGKFHIDHIEPIRRNSDGSCLNPQNESLSNMNPSCPSCNIMKHNQSIDQFRAMVKNFVTNLNKYNNQYKFAKKYGLVTENDVEVKFYFETLND